MLVTLALALACYAVARNVAYTLMSRADDRAIERWVKAYQATPFFTDPPAQPRYWLR